MDRVLELAGKDPKILDNVISWLEANPANSVDNFFQAANSVVSAVHGGFSGASNFFRSNSTGDVVMNNAPNALRQQSGIGAKLGSGSSAVQSEQLRQQDPNGGGAQAGASGHPGLERHIFNLPTHSETYIFSKKLFLHIRMASDEYNSYGVTPGLAFFDFNNLGWYMSNNEAYTFARSTGFKRVKHTRAVVSDFHPTTWMVSGGSNAAYSMLDGPLTMQHIKPTSKFPTVFGCGEFKSDSSTTNNDMLFGVKGNLDMEDLIGKFGLSHETTTPPRTAPESKGSTVNTNSNIPAHYSYRAFIGTDINQRAQLLNHPSDERAEGGNVYDVIPYGPTFVEMEPAATANSYSSSGGSTPWFGVPKKHDWMTIERTANSGKSKSYMAKHRKVGDTTTQEVFELWPLERTCGYFKEEVKNGAMWNSRLNDMCVYPAPYSCVNGGDGSPYEADMNSIKPLMCGLMPLLDPSESVPFIQLRFCVNAEIVLERKIHNGRDFQDIYASPEGDDVVCRKIGSDNDTAWGCWHQNAPMTEREKRLFKRYGMHRFVAVNKTFPNLMEYSDSIPKSVSETKSSVISPEPMDQEPPRSRPARSFTTIPHYSTKTELEFKDLDITYRKDGKVKMGKSWKKHTEANGEVIYVNDKEQSVSATKDTRLVQ